MKVKVTQSHLALCGQYWSGQPFPSPGDLPNPGTEPRSPALQADSLPTELSGKPREIGIHVSKSKTNKNRRNDSIG